MPESGRRVMLLARPGLARDRVRAALSEVGAELVLEADPTQAGVDELATAGAQLVIVVLDTATEAALDRFDAVLLDPAVDVMYEEAELAANRSGWDAARWTRHLAAKLHGHGDVLPPGRMQAEPAPIEPAPIEPVAASAHPIADQRQEPHAGNASHVPGETAFDGFVTFASGEAAPPPEPIDFDAGNVPLAATSEALEFDGFAPLLETAPSHPLSTEFSPGVEPGSFAGFDPVAAEMAEMEFDADQVITFDTSLREDFAPVDADAGTAPSGFDLAFESELMLPEATSPTAPIDSSQFHDFSLDDLRVEPALPALELPEPAFDVLAAEPVREPTASDSPFAGLSGGHVLALVSDDAPAPAAATRTSGLNIADLEQRIASLSLVEEAAPAAAAAEATDGSDATPVAASLAHGAVLLVAGLGGPDAVRQVLAAMPEGFPRPVLVQQRLDGGRYDRLVTQLQRVTALPVDLADPGADARPGVVYVLPDGVGLQAGPDGLRFDGTDPLDALPPADSAVLLLSGADAALAARLVANTWSQALIAGQSAEGCYDATASNALAECGRPTATPAELARQLVERWAA
jgi:chemosensory pili system protein ChpB (putative protein-glutamate methylesterase)